MKVLIVGPKSVHIKNFIDSITELESSVYLLTEEGTDFLPSQRSFIYSFRGVNILRWLVNFFKLKKTINKLNPDVVHIHQANRLALFVLLAKRKRLPAVLTVWGSDVLLIPQESWFKKRLTKSILKQSDLLTANSKNQINTIKDLVKEEKRIEFLHYGIDMVEPSIKEDIIYSNRLHQPLYQIGQIIDYFKEFAIDNPNYKLIIGATGKQTKLLKQKVKLEKMNDRVEFVGWLDKKENQSWYARAKIYISIPQSDGLSGSLLEAMSAGCVPIVSDIAVAKEWITNGENGIIEKKGENPFYKIKGMNIQQCRDINTNMVKTIVDRKVCTSKFYELYHEVKSK